MHSAMSKSNSIGNALFDVTVQLTAPTVTSTASLTTKSRACTTVEDTSESTYSPLRKSRYSLSSMVISFPKRSTTNSFNLIHDPPASQSSNHLTVPRDANNNRTMSSSKSEESLSGPKSHSPSPSRHRQQKSIRNALVHIWQGLSHDDLSSTASATGPAKPQQHVEIATKKTMPRWRAFSKVVTSLLMFTRTRKERYEWIQLVGHPGTFKEGLHDGTVMKEASEHERYCCERLQHDLLKEFVPRYNGVVRDDDGKLFIEMEDLLSSFHQPCIMDCKIGVRTYLEEDLNKSERDPEPRADLYEKMLALDPTAPTDAEHREQKILKPRYMIWRESLSSSQELGFRIEAIKKCRGLMSKEFQRMKERSDVRKQFREFIADSPARAKQYLDRLLAFRSQCLRSNFFFSHEIIGSSLLFVHDDHKASVWMIDFGKTRPLPSGIRTTHSAAWTRGSHEDGYLVGLDHLISLFHEIISELKLSLLSNSPLCT